MEKVSAPRSAKATVHAMGRKRRPSTACKVKMGRYAVMMMAIAKNTGRCTSCAASRILSIGVRLPLPCERWRTMFSTMTTAPSTTMPKSSAPSESRLAGIWRRSRQVAANKSEKGIVRHDDRCAAHIAEEEEENDGDQNHALGQIVQHSVRREVEQFAAIDKGNKRNALRQDQIVELLDPRVDSLERWLCVGAFLQRDDAADDIVVVDQLSILAVIGVAELPKADHRALLHHAKILHRTGVPALVVITVFADVLNVADQANFANIDLLLSLLDKAAAAVGIVVGRAAVQPARCSVRSR